jgi:hypothetical protein
LPLLTRAAPRHGSIWSKFHRAPMGPPAAARRGTRLHPGGRTSQGGRQADDREQLPWIALFRHRITWGIRCRRMSLQQRSRELVLFRCGVVRTDRGHAVLQSVFDAPSAQAATIRARCATRAGTCHTRPPYLMRDELWPGFETLISSRTREWEGLWTLVGGCGSD